MNQFHILRLNHRLEINRRQITALLGEITFLVEDIGNAATHSGREISAARAKHHDQAVSHVFAAVVADSLHNRGRTGIADGEALACNAAEESLAASGTIEHDITDQNIFFRSKARLLRRIHDQPATGESFANVVIGIALERHRHALSEKCAEALAGGTVELDANRIVWQSVRSVAPRDLSASQRAYRP